MYVKNRMTSNPYIVAPEDTVNDTMMLMRQKRVKSLPVVKNGKLVGIVTEKQLAEITPSPATTLSVFEVSYLLSKTKIETIMTKEVVTISSDDLLEQASLLMRNHNVSCLPVLDNNKLVGIICESDIFDSFIDIMGLRDTGTRISIEIAEDKPGIVAEVAGIIAQSGINITHLVLYRNELIIRVNTLNVEQVEKSLSERGYAIKSILKSE